MVLRPAQGKKFISQRMILAEIFLKRGVLKNMEELSNAKRIKI